MADLSGVALQNAMRALSNEAYTAALDGGAPGGHRFHVFIPTRAGIARGWREHYAPHYTG